MGKKKQKRKATVVDSSDDDQVSENGVSAMVVDLSLASDDQVIKRKPKKVINLAASLDTDIEEIQNPETAEEELGEFQC